MKVLSAEEMQRIESLSFRDHGQEQEAEFMERAGEAVAKIVSSLAPVGLRVFLLCGKGNNAGDAYVVGRYLQEYGFTVTALQVFPIDELKHLARSNAKAFQGSGGSVVSPEQALLFEFPSQGLIIDGLLGTGFQGSVRNPIANMIRKANASDLAILSIDVPSGLNASQGLLSEHDPVINARWTLALEFAKSGFFLGDAWNKLGQLRIVKFGLDQNYEKQAHETFRLLEKNLIVPLLPKIQRNRHKYQRGSLALVAGSSGMAGAAILASHAGLRGGAGIVRLIHPKEITVELSQAPIELLRLAYDSQSSSHQELILKTLNKAKAVVMGPGLGQSDSVRALLNFLVPRIEVPLVLDADGLNLLEKGFNHFPPQTILTPHTGEMARLLGLSKTVPVSLDFLDRCQNYVNEKKVSLVLKGGPSFILQPNTVPSISLRGDPGMATAGSGDILAGILGALLAQNCPSHAAAMLGTYLHGLAGERAAYEKTSYAMIASDILAKIPDAYAVLARRG